MACIALGLAIFDRVHVAILSGALAVNGREIEGLTGPAREAVCDAYRDGLWSLGSPAVLTFAMLGLMVWFHRAYRNLHPLGSSRHGVSPGMAVGSFFLPIYNLVGPLFRSSYLWRASDPEVDGEDRAAIRRVELVPVVWLWWAFFLLYAFSQDVTKPCGLGGGLDFGFLFLQAGANSLSNVCGALSALCAILFVRGVERRQSERSKRMGLMFDDQKENGPVVKPVGGE